jgi:hypothetical protein
MEEAFRAALLGACGGLLYELVELARILKAQGHFPWSRRGHGRVVRRDGVLRRYQSFSVYFVTIVIRATVGAAVAAVLSTAGPLSALAAVIAGAGSYSVVDRWAFAIPVNDGQADALAAAARVSRK